MIVHLVDGTYELFRHFYGIRRFSKTDPPLGAAAGTFRLKHKLLFIANALKQHHIGLEETDDGIWTIYFGTVLLAKVDEREMIIRD